MAKLSIHKTSGKWTVDKRCQAVNLSRQAYYQQQKRAKATQTKHDLLWKEIAAYRKKHRYMGAEKLYSIYQPYMKEIGLKMGRDAFFTFLRDKNELSKPKKRYCKTTHPGKVRFENLVSNIILNRVNQVWVSDITYIDSDAGWLYLSLVTDLYSRRIIGYHLSQDLKASSCLEAFKNAVKLTGRSNCQGVIHHSDHGVQYSCPLYCDGVKSVNGLSSMGAVGSCYDNAVAERVNGILKREYGLYARFSSFTEAEKSVKQGIDLYNIERPHWALNLLTPDAFYQHAMNDFNQMKSQIQTEKSP